VSIAVLKADFHGTTLYGSRIGNVVFVALKPIVEAMGIAWHGQLERIKRDPILREGIRVTRIPSERGGSQQAVGLRLDLIHGWLLTISANRIKDGAIRAKVMLFQRECYQVLWRHFSGSPAVVLPSPSQESRSIRLIHEARLTYGTRAAAQLWKLRGLPEVPAMEGALAQGDLFDKDD
jgi:hypothetical protein